MFANDGGALVLGVDEPRPGHFSVHPIDLAGLPERIQQVATSRLEPPLAVEVTTIPTDADSTRGFVVVRVPASPDSPHMTDERYFGRAGSTRTTLSDSQVRRIITSRRAETGRVQALLDADVARDPIPRGERCHTHVHVVALPRFAPIDIVLQSVVNSGGNWSTWFRRDLQNGTFDPPIVGTLVMPDLMACDGYGSRANGWATWTPVIGQDRLAADVIDATDPVNRAYLEAHMLDLEMDEDGAIHLLCGRGSDHNEQTDEEVVVPTVIVGMPLRVVQVARRISELTGFMGTWDFAVAVDDLRGRRAHTPTGGQFATGPVYTRDTYQSTAAATTTQLVRDERAIVKRLVGRLLRGLGLNSTVDSVLPPRLG